MKLLIWGHWSHTGFGIVTQSLSERLLSLGVDVRVLAYNLRGEQVKGPMAGRVFALGFIEQFVKGVHRFAIDGQLWTLLDEEDEWKPDAALFVADVSGLRGYISDEFSLFEKFPAYHYCPIEGGDLPPLWRGVWEHVQPVTMSRYGQRVVSELLGRDVPMVYHGVDTEKFYPVSPGRPIRFEKDTMRSKEECKAKFSIPPETRVLLRADRNVARKNYEALFRTFVDIGRADPDCWLVLHTKATDRDGQDLRQELVKLPDDVRDRVKFTGSHDSFKGLPTEGLNALYNAADIYVSTTGGEGFGLTLAESLAAGVPVVTNGYAAEVEVVGDGGVIVPPLTDKYGEVVTFYNPIFGMAWSKTDERAFAPAVIDLLRSPKRRKSLGAMGRLHVQRSFSWDTAAAEFVNLLLPDASEAAA